MDNYSPGRRTFLMSMTALGAASLPFVRAVRAADAGAGAAAKTAYDPAATFDMTLAPEAPYPACIQDANYGVRWLKSKAASWNGDPSKIGIYGSSSGGHVAELLGMRPRDKRYNA